MYLDCTAKQSVVWAFSTQQYLASTAVVQCGKLCLPKIFGGAHFHAQDAACTLYSKQGLWTSSMAAPGTCPKGRMSEHLPAPAPAPGATVPQDAYTFPHRHGGVWEAGLPATREWYVLRTLPPCPPLHLIWWSNFKFFKSNNYRKITMSQNILPREYSKLYNWKRDKDFWASLNCFWDSQEKSKHLKDHKFLKCAVTYSSYTHGPIWDLEVPGVLEILFLVGFALGPIPWADVAQHGATLWEKPCWWRGKVRTKLSTTPVPAKPRLSACQPGFWKCVWEFWLLGFTEYEIQPWWVDLA